MHIGGVEYEVRDLRSEISRKADQHEIHTLNSKVDSLECTVRGLRSATDGLQCQLQAVEEIVRRLSDATS